MPDSRFARPTVEGQSYDTHESSGKVGRSIIYLTLGTALLFKGAAIPVAFLVSCLGVALATLLASLRWPRNQAVRWVGLASLLIGVLLTGLAFFQSVVFERPILANPIWSLSNPLLFVNGYAASVAPTETREAVPTLLAPFLLFVACLAHFRTDAEAFRLLRVLAGMGGAFAAFGLLQITFLQDSLLLFPKEHYLDSLTSVFVNRNTAGTFLGVAGLVGVMVLVESSRPRPTDLAAWNRHPSGLGIPTRCVLPAMIVGLCVVALLLTKSRGALLSALLGFGATLPLLALQARRPDRHSQESDAPRSSRIRRVLFAVGVLLAIGVVASLFGGLTAARINSDQSDPGRLCLFKAAGQAFLDNWRLGTGFATFETVFPGYRSADCAESATAFIRAHNFYLEGLVGFGIAFIPAVVAIYGIAAFVLLRGFRTRRRNRFVPILGLGIVLLVTAHGMVDFSLQIPGMASYTAAVMAAVTTVCLRERRRRPSEPQEAS